LIGEPGRDCGLRDRNALAHEIASAANACRVQKRVGRQSKCALENPIHMHSRAIRYGRQLLAGHVRIE
jgi:hypothetical protein